MLSHLGRVDAAGLRSSVCPGNRGDLKLRILDLTRRGTDWNPQKDARGVFDLV